MVSPPPDFESGASTSSAIPAGNQEDAEKIHPFIFSARKPKT
jgi:hypothetical protein